MPYTLGQIRIQPGGRGNIPMAGVPMAGTAEQLATFGTGTIWLVGAGVIALLWWLAKREPEEEVIPAEAPKNYQW